jgi:hypothetical protein
VLVRLQTADHIRLASPVQEEQDAPAPDDGTRILGFAIGEEHNVLVLGFDNRGGRIFSALLWPHNGLLSLCETHLESFLEYIPPLTHLCLDW